MIITANLATFPSREKTIVKTLSTLTKQSVPFDEIRVHINDRENYLLTDDQLCALGVTKITVHEKDLADNGKFCSIGDNELAFCMDDDLGYPAQYVSHMRDAVERLGCIVTHHGRPQIKLPLRHYYQIKPVISCLKANSREIDVLILGTGVCAFKTSYFKPRGCDIKYPRKMADCIFSEQVAEEGKRMVCLKHGQNYFRYFPPPTTIHTTESRKPTPYQVKIATKIAKMKRSSYRHFVLTRYNYGLYSDNPYNISDPEKWMRERYDIFKKTVESVHNQTEQNFEWVIFIDPDTPQDWETKIREASLAKIVREIPQDWMSKVPRGDKAWLITTRFDCDDRLMPHFIERVQACFEPQEFVIDTGGEQIDIRTGERYASGRDTPNSPFISLVEEWGDKPKTAFYKPHSNMNGLFPTRHLKDEILWQQVIHDNNIMNKIIGTKK